MARTINFSDNLPASCEPATPAPVDWVNSLERSKAQIAAGQTVPVEPVLNMLLASIARMDAKRTEATKT